MGELSGFTVDVVKDIQARPLASPLAGNDSSHSLYLFGLPMQAAESGILAFHNGHTDELKQGLSFSANLQADRSPIPGWPAGEWMWRLSGKHVIHPDQFLGDQPVMAQLAEAIRLLETVAAGRMDYSGFISRLDRIGLPLEWRNHLANEVFKHAAPSLPPQNLPAGDALADLLSRVDVPGEKAMSAAEAFIQEVGTDSTGFILDREKAMALRDAFAVFKKQMQAHAEQAGLAYLLGWAAGLAALVKVLRGRQKQWGWILPPASESGRYNEALSSFQGEVEILVIAGYDNWEEAWTPGYASLAERAKMILIQIPDGGFSEFKENGRQSPYAGKIFLTGGWVRCAFGNEGCALKPAALAYAEACLAGKRVPGDARQEILVLADQDPCPGRLEKHVAEKILPESEWVSRCRNGENLLNGKLGTTQVFFRPLVSIEDAL